jgi:hypothetical protein
MKPTPTPLQSASSKSGFALVVTLSLMILLTIMAVGLLTLSSISLRASSQGSSASIARTNARLAMMLALGDLQKFMGPDQSVSASAAAVVENAKRPNLTGVWRSWRWTPGSGSPSYAEKKNGFKGWLVSTANPKESALFPFGGGAEPSGANAIPLVGDPADENALASVSGEKVKVGGSRQPGKFAWAVFDESTKAAIDLGDPERALPEGLEIASRVAPHRYRADVLHPSLASLRKPDNLISLDTAVVPAGATNKAEFHRRFHDFTTGSIGLLTDTGRGGLKTDLTPLFEADSMPAGAFTGSTANSPYEGFPTSSGAPKWAFLRDHYRKYKSVSTAATGESAYRVTDPRSTDLRINPAGVSPSPDTERLLPAIAKFQLVFSLVSHHAHVSDRVSFLNNFGDPRGNMNHAVIHLAYDPVITLYNPYDVTLNLQKLRIRIWDPPVGFRFTKIDRKAGTSVPFRVPGPGQEPAFESLAQMQIANERNLGARKCFTLILADGTPNAASNSLRLRPGEVKVFSPRVESSWTWGMEVGIGDYNPRSFFDWNAGNNFGNKDSRTPMGLGRWGVESVPGWTTVAGLQTDHLSYGARDPATLYPFEKDAAGRQRPGVGGFVSLRLSDEVKVEAIPKVVSAGASRHFQVDILAGLTEGADSTGVSNDLQNAGVSADRLRSYSFNFDGTDPSQEISAEPEYPIVERQYLVGQILQRLDEGAQNPRKPGLKKPFAMLEMSARTTKDELTDSKPWLYNNFVVEGAEQNSRNVGLTHQSYDLRFIPMTSFTDFPDGIAIDPGSNRGYFGPSDSAAEGSSFVNMLHVPLAPAASLGDFVPANLASGSLLPRVVHPFGNSRAHPLIPSNQITNSSGGTMLDHSYLLNDGLWDTYYFSSFTAYGGVNGGVMPETKSLKEVITGVFDGTKPALNSRIIPAVPVGDASKAAQDLAALPDIERARTTAKHVAVSGSFNLNSTSVEAWRAVLSSLRDRAIHGLKLDATGAALSKENYQNPNETPLARVSKPLAGSNPASHLRWAGFRTVTDEEVKTLAENIVAEIKLRGVVDSAPPLTLAEFVNRRIDGSDKVHSLAGLLQTAIDKSGINDRFHTNPDGTPRDSKELSAASISAKRKKGVETPEVLDGWSAEGAPSMVTQGDLMAALAPIATVRGDTFKIRSYGEATSSDGKTVLARAWCEAVVQRNPDFVDPADAAEIATAALSSISNKNFGRRFSVVSFRWLDQAEL